MIQKKLLTELYFDQGLSMMQIAQKLNCSQNKVVYWMNRHKIARRNISEAIYIKANPNGDPFKFGKINSMKKSYLLGLGIGLYWGEGTKANKYSVCLGNSNPILLLNFIDFLEQIFNVKKSDMKFGLQIFSDIDPELAVNYWTRMLRLDRSQLYKVHVTISGSIGTYRNKSKYGVMTLYYHNKKLRDKLVSLMPG